MKRILTNKEPMTYDKFSEIFFDIPGWEGQYQINLKEDVRSVERRDSGGWPRPQILMKKRLNVTGYWVVNFCKDSKHYEQKIHRLLALTFLQNPKKHPLVRHLNDNRTDNHISNLRWGTHKENVHDGYANNKTEPKFYRNEYNAATGTIERISPVAKIILDTSNGIFYDSITEAALSKGMRRKRLSRQLSGERKNKTSFIYA